MNILTRTFPITRKARPTIRLQQVATHLIEPTTTPPPIHVHSAPSHTMSSPSMPKTMKGVLIQKTGGVEVLDHHTSLPVPTPGPTQLLIHNELVGLNYIDTYFRTGLYPSPKPEILGREAEGHVVALGADLASHPGSRFKVGDRVCWMAQGAYCEYAAIEPKNVFHVPEDIPKGAAAASILHGLTAVTLVDEAHSVRSGDWFLVHAAAGGVGQWLVQVLKARGAHTIATASTGEKRELARKLGADVAVGYDHDELIAAVKKATNGEGVAAAFDGVGQDTFEVSLEAVARKGTVVSFGNASGAVAPFPIAKLSAKNVKVVRPMLWNYIVTEEEKERYSGELWDLLRKGVVEVNIHKTYALSDVRQAHTDLESRKTTGKLMLDPAK